MSEQDPLPPLPVWAARSSYAALMTVALVVLSALGFKPSEWLETKAIGRDEIIDTLMLVSPLVPAAWAWIERKNPLRRLVWWQRK